MIVRMAQISITRGALFPNAALEHLQRHVL
jgi:hypothetical protein